MISTTIKKIKLRNVSIKNFYKNFLSEQNLVLITSAFGRFPSLEKWNLEYLLSKLDSRVIQANVTDENVYGFNDKIEPNFSTIDINLIDILRRLIRKILKKKCMLKRISILNESSKLKDDLQLLDYIPNKYSVNLWLGLSSNTSSLHFDYFDFIYKWFGKKMWLYSSKHFYGLRLNFWESKTSHVSRVDSESIDSINYPEAFEIEKMEIVISRGNILFLPAY